MKLIICFNESKLFTLIILSFLFWIRGNSIFQKTYFMGPGEWIKPRLFQTLTRDASPDSNSRPAVQISSILLLRYAPWNLKKKQWKEKYQKIINNILKTQWSFTFHKTGKVGLWCRVFFFFLVNGPFSFKYCPFRSLYKYNKIHRPFTIYWTLKDLVVSIFFIFFILVFQLIIFSF